MSDLNTAGADAPSETPAFVHQAPVDAPKDTGVSGAARLLASMRHKRQESEPAAPPVAAAEQPQSPAQAEDASPPEVPGETQAQAEPEAETLPTIEPPRSWKSAEKERFAALPRETQEYLAQRETERDREFQRGQNDAAEKLKGLTVREQAAEQARQQYESALPQLHQVLQSQQQSEFTDIKSIADVEKLAREDWPRYLQWDVAQKKLAAVEQEMQSAKLRQQQEKLQKFSEFAKKEDDAFIERVPDMADADKASKLQKSAMAVLKDLGFSDTELGQSWNGDKDLSLRDHRVQLLIRDATLYREAQARTKTLTAKPVPQVQRPGTSTGRSASKEAELQTLAQRLDHTGNPKDAAAFLRARRAAAR